MSRETWELISWIATTVASVVAVVGVIVVIVQLRWQAAQLRGQAQQSRLEFLTRLYGEFDTAEARLERAWIYGAPQEHLIMEFLHAKGHEKERAMVENTLAMLDRVSYPIISSQVPSDDAFSLWGGVFLSVAYKLWPYVEEQRDMRRKSGLRHRVGYRASLEKVVLMWAPKYAAEGQRRMPSGKLSVREVLSALFPEAQVAGNPKITKSGKPESLQPQ